MYPHERQALQRIATQLRGKFADRDVALYAFGSRVPGTHSAWSHFDLLVVVRDKKPQIEDEIISLLIHLPQETSSWLSSSLL